MIKSSSSFFLLSFLICLCLGGCTKSNTAPVELSVSKQFKNPIDFYDATPSFSWKLPSGVTSQSAYRIVAASSPDLLPNKTDVWNSGKVESDQSLDLNYKGTALSSRQKVYWQVQCWDENGEESAWNEVAHFELGLLNNADWQGKWISIPHDQLVEKDYRESLLFSAEYNRKEIEIDNTVKNARLYVISKV